MSPVYLNPCVSSVLCLSIMRVHPRVGVVFVSSPHWSAVVECNKVFLLRYFT